MPVTFERFLPDAADLLVVLPLALIYALFAGLFAGRLRGRGTRAPYTRKLFHFLIITGAAVVDIVAGLGGVVAYAIGVVIVIVMSLFRADGDPLYEALARPTDEPHRTLFIVVPLVTTGLGGILTNLIFPSWAAVGYMAVAWGDAVGEPVGTRWGRRRYRVPSLGGVPAQRSLEGSGAVLIATWIACAGLFLVSGLPLSTSVSAAFVVGAATAAVEAFSHHGLDNLTIQLAASATAALLLG